MIPVWATERAAEIELNRWILSGNQTKSSNEFCVSPISKPMEQIGTNPTQSIGLSSSS